MFSFYQVISLWVPRLSLACDILRNCYEAFALYSFGSYLVACLGKLQFFRNTIKFWLLCNFVIFTIFFFFISLVSLSLPMFLRGLDQWFRIAHKLLENSWDVKINHSIYLLNFYKFNGMYLYLYVLVLHELCFFSLPKCKWTNSLDICA